MSIENDNIPQAVLDGILARVLREEPASLPKLSFGIQRILCHRADVFELFELSSLDAARVSVYDLIVKRNAALGDLVSSRRVGHFVVRLVRGHESDSEIWRIVEEDSRDKRVVILTYVSDGVRARDAAFQYAADATEVDLTSDFDSGAHFFGERRLPRAD